ncbi:cysteine hydrolase family protein [Candidatus Nitrospira bockiana]
MTTHEGLKAGVNESGASTVEYLPKEEPTPIFPRDRTVLLVVDPVNDFLSEGGAGWDLVKTTVTMNEVVANLKRLIEGARNRRIPVLFGPMAYVEEDYADKALQQRSGINRIMFEQKMFLAGSWGADFHPDLRPREDEIVLLPHKGIDVFETDLPEHLRRLGTTHLVIAGMTANLCCESTGRHAMERGYDVTFISDAVGAESVLAYEASIRINYPLVANAVMTVDEFLAAVDARVAPGVKVQAGDRVRGSDDGEIGVVDRVVEATSETDGHLVVPSGIIFQQDLFIPLDAVVKRTDSLVFINVPKIVVGQMPWKEPPRRTDRPAKLGPSAGGVKKLYRSRAASVQERAE